MIKSGYLIGQIIDEFSALGEQAKLRNRLGLTDISVYSENFFRDILNIIGDYELSNTNDKSANEPGIDLGDEINKIAFQLTTTNSSEKVKHTLQQITDDHLTKYDRYVVLIIGDKQNTYDAVHTALKKPKTNKINSKLKFDPENDIMDLTDLARKAVGLKLESVQALHKLVQDQMSKVRIEFQVPDKDGNYETSGFALWEKLPSPKPGTGRKFARWEYSKHSSDVLPDDEVESAKDAIDELSKRLYKLPRITREFLAELFVRSEEMKLRFRDYRSIFLPTVDKTYPDVETELDLLLAQNLIDVNGDELGNGLRSPVEIGLQMGLGHEGLQMGFYDFITENKLSIRRVIVELDFSEF
ncbi:SMEK domain-containing protein [Pseudomonas sp. PCH446]